MNQLIASFSLPWHIILTFIVIFLLVLFHNTWRKETDLFFAHLIGIEKKKPKGRRKSRHINNNRVDDAQDEQDSADGDDSGVPPLANSSAISVSNEQLTKWLKTNPSLKQANKL